MKRTPSPESPAANTDAILQSISDGVFTVDMEWRVTSFNRAAEHITGVKREEALGRLCGEVLRSSLCGSGCALARTLKSGRPIIGKSAYFINAKGVRIPISLSTAVLRDPNGKIVGGAEVFRDLSEIDALRQELEGRHHAGRLSSHSPLMQRLFETLPAISTSRSTVLIQGETGTGKELLARTIHEMSPLKNGPFVALNCGALPDTLLESELFGYKAGAFTDAKKDKPGRFALAKGGTLFLDEIGEISPAMQVKLLRVLQERLYEPLGAVKPERADVRIVAATNRDLLQRCREGEFREDLYYRINVMKLELPPLRSRSEDITLLAGQFIERFNRLQNKKIQGIAPEALSLMMAHPWPGNIRELENTIERAFILCTSGRIGVEHLPETIFASGPMGDDVSPKTLAEARNGLDAKSIRAALSRHGGSREATARELGIHRATLYRRMKRLGITDGNS